MDILKKMRIKDKGKLFFRNAFLLISLFSAIAIFVGIMISEKFISDNDRKINESVSRECEYLSILSEEMIDSVITQVKNIVQIKDLTSVFSASPSDRFYYERTATICDELERIAELNQNIDSIYLYSKYRDEVLTDEGTLIYDIFNDKSWIVEYLKSNKTEFKNYFRTAYGGKNVMTFLYHVNSGEASDGCIVVNVDMERYMSVIKKEGFSVIAKNGTNEIIFITRGEKNREIAEKLLKCDNGIVKADGNYWALAKKESNFGSFSYIYAQPLESYPSDVGLIYAQIVLILILLIVVFAFIAFKIAEATYKPITEIGEILENPYSQKSKKYLENDKNTKKIADKIFSVVYTNEMLCRELNSKMENFNYAQLKALQWQINPHFIFNTLNMLYLLTEDTAGKGNKASQSILSLSKLMRHSLKTEPITVPLKDELKFVDEYVKIMSVRLGDSFSFEVIRDESFKERSVIKMCIQPVLENAFRYGIKNLKKRGIIKIKISDENGCLKIEITDNGYGMTAEKLGGMRERLARPPELAEEHIGLLNVNSRLKLLYGEQYGIKLESAPNEGTKVTFVCPNR